MTINKRIKYITKHINKIGLFSTLSYFIQRLAKTKGSVIAVKIKGLRYPVYLRSKTYDSNIFYQIFIDEELEISYNGTIKTILDLGGNIGLSTLFFLRKFPQAEIITVEPASNNFNLLTKNTERYSNVKRLHAGVYSKDCTLYLVDIGKGEASYRVVEDAGTCLVMDTINCMSIDSIRKKFQLQHIDLLKMDIEGSEEACVINAPIDWLFDTTYFMVEIHDSLKAGLTSAIKATIPPAFQFSQHGEYSIFHAANSQMKAV
ncbi:FkbM family methyltransferase [Lacibacter sp. H375]|uniref:FkbM family methyltransferase n=1 Tax=Lacibacter sp. H375 TaxID=3133424 RepID=UPI0030C1FF4F